MISASNKGSGAREDLGASNRKSGSSDRQALPIIADSLGFSGLRGGVEVSSAIDSPFSFFQFRFHRVYPQELNGRMVKIGAAIFTIWINPRIRNHLRFIFAIDRSILTPVREGLSLDRLFV